MVLTPQRFVLTNQKTLIKFFKPRGLYLITRNVKDVSWKVVNYCGVTVK